MGNLTSNIALIVDLAAGKVTQEEIEDDFYAEHVGGASANLALYNKYIDDDPVVFGTGLLTGTLFPGAASGVITGKSPKTGKVCHGPFCLYGGTELKYTGFDFIVLKGHSAGPVYLWLHDQVADVHDASGLWGTDTWAVTESLRKSLGEDLIQVISIGEAGEKGLACADIALNYWPIGDRWGFGQVLGKKNVKAIALRGLGIFDLARPAEFVEYCRNLHVKIRSGAISQHRGNIEFPDYLGEGQVKPWIEPLVHRCKACFACPYPCNTFVKYREDRSIMKETDVQEPGFLLTDAAAVLAMKKAGLSGEDTGKLLELSSRHGVNSLAVAAHLQAEGITTYSAVSEGFSGLLEGIGDDGIFPWSPEIPEACAESAQQTFSTWTPPKPLFADFKAAGGVEETAAWWTRRNGLAYVTGICPIFMLMAPEINEESLIEALVHGSDLDLTVQDLDKAVAALVG